MYRQFEQLESLTTYFTTELNSLTNGKGVLGGEIDNSGASPDMFMDLEFVSGLPLNLSGQTNPTIDIYFVYALDGTNYTDATNNNSTDALHPPSQNIACKFQLRVGTGAEAKRAVIKRIMIPRCKFKMYLVNECGATLQILGNTLKYTTYRESLS